MPSRKKTIGKRVLSGATEWWRTCLANWRAAQSLHEAKTAFEFQVASYCNYKSRHTSRPAVRSLSMSADHQ